MQARFDYAKFDLKSRRADGMDRPAQKGGSAWHHAGQLA